jgi:hypothetical protein
VELPNIGDSQESEIVRGGGGAASQVIDIQMQ